MWPDVTLRVRTDVAIRPAVTFHASTDVAIRPAVTLHASTEVAIRPAVTLHASTEVANMPAVTLQASTEVAIRPAVILHATAEVVAVRPAVTLHINAEVAIRPIITLNISAPSPTSWHNLDSKLEIKSPHILNKSPLLSYVFILISAKVLPVGEIGWLLHKSITQKTLYEGSRTFYFSLPPNPHPTHIYPV